ncbi:MAG: hypothetical protein KDE47_22485, partial [Caldilineaceae bacterium]|nr:hypothetical protein [Caldilineaceae bacterium]
MVIPTPPAQAEPAAQPLNWTTVSELARAAFDAGPGQVWRAEVAGARHAADAVPGSLESLELSGNWEHSWSGDGDELGLGAG